MTPVETRHVYCPMCGGTLCARFRRSIYAAALTCSRCEQDWRVTWPLEAAALEDDEILITRK